MTKRVFFGVCLLLLLALSGCTNPGNGPQGDKNVKVIIEEGGRFPAYLVGTWRAEDSGWQFVFEPDGTISSAVIDEGMANVVPSDKRAEVELSDGGNGFYELGEWTVRYSSQRRELMVEVVVELFRLNMIEFGLTGYAIDRFAGIVSDDAKVWDSYWRNSGETIAFSPDGSGQEVVFTPESGENWTKHLKFTKIPKED